MKYRSYTSTIIMISHQPVQKAMEIGGEVAVPAVRHPQALVPTIAVTTTMNKRPVDRKVMEIGDVVVEVIAHHHLDLVPTITVTITMNKLDRRVTGIGDEEALATVVAEIEIVT